MPDAFWITKNDEDNEIEEDNEDNVISFDEQIDKLMNNDYSSKTKRRTT